MIKFVLAALAACSCAVAQDPPVEGVRAPIGNVTIEPVAPVVANEKEAITDFPKLGKPEIVKTTFPDGLWHHRNGVARDNTGDGNIINLVEGDRRRRILIMRMGTPPPGGCFWEQPADSPVTVGWTGNQQQPPIKALPGLRPHSHGNIDTHVGVQNPYTGVVTFAHGVKPGALREFALRDQHQGAGGLVFALQRATSASPGVEASNWTRYPNELFLKPHPDAPWENPVYYPRTNQYWGGVAECALLYDVFIDKFVLFYTGKTREDPDAFGQRHRSRIGRAFAEPTGFDTNPVWVRDPAPGPESYVFDSVRDGAGGKYGDTNAKAIWGTANTILQQHVSIDPKSGIYHLVCNGKKPSTRGGLENASVGYAHYYSFDQGATWHADKGNPIVTWDSLGWENINVANRLNSPNMLWDTWSGKAHLFFWGNEVGRTNKKGTRLYVFTFDM